MTQENPFNKIWNEKPTSELCDRLIEIDVVGKRCIYINNHRVEGGKPYVSENLPSMIKKTPLRELLDAFSDKEIRAYLKEKRERKKYFDNYHTEQASNEDK